MQINYKISDFEGPLDLLLHLISKHKMNICDIEILALVEQFSDYLKVMDESNMEVAGEFVEMASRLVYIKTVFLLPKHEKEQDELKAQLTGELMEYRACKLAAAKLREQSLLGDIFISNGEDIEPDKTFKGTMPLSAIHRAYLDALGKGKRRLPPPQSTFTPLVSKRIVSVTSRIIFVLKSLYKNVDIKLGELFESSTERSEMVATFLAVLELVKSKRVSVTETNSLKFHGREEQC